jgi:3-phenylpropionate/cinnamic acid dioxygenase small subunit
MSELQELIDRQAITDLVARLGVMLDDKRFEDAPAILTEDVAVETQGGSSRGIEAVTTQARRNHEVPTQHVITNVLVDLDGDRATARANLVATFVHADSRRVLGERYGFEAARTPEGWRLSSVRVTPVWEERQG